MSNQHDRKPDIKINHETLEEGMAHTHHIWFSTVDKTYQEPPPSGLVVNLCSGCLWMIAATADQGVLSCLAFPEPTEEQNQNKQMTPVMLFWKRPLNLEEFEEEVKKMTGIEGASAALDKDSHTPSDRYPVLGPIYERLVEFGRN